MYDFDFDPETNGLELSWRDTGGEISRREARPVYAGEMNLLGFRRVFDYPRDTGLPLMWSEQTGYFYKGVKIAKLKSSEFVEMPEVVRLDNLFGTEEHVLRAKIEELKDNNCPLFR